MIGFNFEYYKPAKIDEAVKTYSYLASTGKSPTYFNGGTEIITFARTNSIHPGSVIDIKEIPECNVMELNHGRLTIGASVTLSQISDANPFPLLSKVSREIADRTARNKITLGGNICGKIRFREAILPFLISDSYVVIAGNNGMKAYPINEVFDGSLKLQPEEFLVQLITPIENLRLSGINIRRRRQSTVGYPLLTIAAVKKDNKVRFAISGISDFPFRSLEMENLLNSRGLSPETKAQNAVDNIPYQVKNDLFGSAEFRKHLLKNALIEIIEALEVEK